MIISIRLFAYFRAKIFLSNTVFKIGTWAIIGLGWKVRLFFSFFFLWGIQGFVACAESPCKPDLTSPNRKKKEKFHFDILAVQAGRRGACGGRGRIDCSSCMVPTPRKVRDRRGAQGTPQPPPFSSHVSRAASSSRNCLERQQRSRGEAQPARRDAAWPKSRRLPSAPPPATPLPLPPLPPLRPAPSRDVRAFRGNRSVAGGEGAQGSRGGEGVGGVVEGGGGAPHDAYSDGLQADSR